MEVIALLLGLVNIVAFLWFLYEIVMLEGWPFRKWHHAYIGIVFTFVAWAWVTSAWLAVLLFVVGGLLIVDDASQHRVHNRMQEEGKHPSQWPTSRLHRLYEWVARKLSARG